MACELADLFLALGRWRTDAVALEEALRAAIAAGRAAWPEVPLAEEAFMRHLARHVPADADLLQEVPARHAADLWLACACAAGEPLALAAFDGRLLNELSSFLLRAREPSDAVAEVRQLLRERLFLPGPDGLPRIASYSGRGPLASWVRVAALRTAASVRRQRKDHAPLGEPDLTADLSAHDPELQILRERHGDSIPQALREAFAALPSRDRALLRMHFLDGLNLERLGLVFQVSRATAGRLMLAARTRLLEETLALLRVRLRLKPEELQSLLGALRSKLDVSLHALLREP